MNTEHQNNKRIAKNTLLLYFRMLLTMGISLYISREVLKQLGVVDFGIYNVVGGFVSMFAFISGAMTTATQRFISFEIGKKEKGNVRLLFSTAVMIHLALALIVLIVAETIGLWFLNSYMNFPPDRYVAVNWVYQFSVLTFMVNVISVPYNAAIVAYERMSAFAYVSIIDVFLKLIVVYFIVVSTFDKLILYAALLALVAISIRIIYGVYCKKNFKECKCDYSWNKESGKKMASFVSWNLIGSVANVTKEQGLNIVLNMFFGVAVNAARGIAYQVLSALHGFVSNFQLAMTPQIVKLYAINDMRGMFKIVFRGSKFSYMMMFTLSLPVIIETPFILNLWLFEVPEYTVIFLRLALITSLINTLSGPLISSMHASGIVRDYQIVVGGISLLTLPIAYVVLKLGYPPQSAMIVGLFISVCCFFARLLLLKRSINFPIKEFFKKVLSVTVLISILAPILPLFCYFYMPVNNWSFLFISFISLMVSAFLCFVIGLNNKEKAFFVNKTIKILKKLKR